MVIRRVWLPRCSGETCQSKRVKFEVSWGEALCWLVSSKNQCLLACYTWPFLQGLMKLVSEGTLEKVKHSFRLSLKSAAESKTPAQHEDVSPEGDASSLQQQVKGVEREVSRDRPFPHGTIHSHVHFKTF